MSRINPIIGLYTTHDMAMTNTETTVPTTKAKIAAAIAIIPPKRNPTSGIQLSKAMIGEKRR